MVYDSNIRQLINWLRLANLSEKYHIRNIRSACNGANAFNFFCPLSAPGEERVDQRSEVGVSNRRNALPVMSLVYFTHPVVASLHHPLFAARKEGKTPHFLKKLSPPPRANVPGNDCVFLVGHMLHYCRAAVYFCLAA